MTCTNNPLDNADFISFPDNVFPKRANGYLNANELPSDEA